MKKISLTVGIPAYNESANISQLLRTILDQNFSAAILKQIIVSNDGSTDNSDELIRSIRDSRIKLISNPTRRGIARGLNQIISQTSTDILVLLDADISLTEDNFIEKLITPLMLHQADLTSSDILPLARKNFVYRVLNTGMRLKNVLFDNYKQGNNLYTCHGLARGLSKKFYSQLYFQAGAGNDMFSYLRCRELGFVFLCVRSAVACFSFPANFRDHFRQNTRYFHAPSLQAQRFSSQLLHAEFHIPVSLIIGKLPNLAVVALSNPVTTLAYFACVLYAKIKSYFSDCPTDIWSMSESSKNLSYV